MKPRSSEARRCRPLLGTFVEITASGQSADQSHRAIDRAYCAIERVQRLMSFHETDSDVSRLNRLAQRRPVKVSPWTYEVLLVSQRLQEASGGAFDITVATQLQGWGYLPGKCQGGSRIQAEGESAIELLRGNRVRFRKPAQIDLGGIAKGFAVDKAIEALRAAGASSGSVNAGGDLRVFGPEASTIHVRHPGSPGQLLPLTRLTNAALATSAHYFTRKVIHGRRVSPLIDPIHNRPCHRGASVSVQAPTCLVADALTKVVMVLGEKSAGILRNYSASAIVLTRSRRAMPTRGSR